MSKAELKFPAAGGGGVCLGTNYICVEATRTPTENAQELQDAYDYAKAQSPAANNIWEVLVFPGEYDFGASAFVLDTPFINVVSMDGNKSVLFTSSNPNGTLQISTNHVFIKGIDTTKVTNKPIILDFEITNKTHLVVENCKSGDDSFNYVDGINGIFTNVEVGNNSFNTTGTIDGDYLFVKGVNGCFVSFRGDLNDGIAATAFFKFCTVRNGAWRCFKSSLRGTYIRCEMRNDSLREDGIQQGSPLVEDCKGRDFCFSQTSNGNYYECYGRYDCFFSSGTAHYCTSQGDTGNQDDFKNTNCYYCRKLNGSFIPGSTSIIVRLCIDGSNAIVNLN